MELAVLLAAGLQDWIDLGVIIGILMLNAIVGWYQEKQAADVVASLKGDIALKCIVIRDGAEVEIPARELVPGDIVSCYLRIFPLSKASYSSGMRITSNVYRLSSKMVPLCQLIAELSRVTTTPTVTQNISQNSKHNVVIPFSRKTMTPSKEKNTVLDTLFSPLINLP
jgi:hypothetical protein